VRLGEAARKRGRADDSDAMEHTALAILTLFSNRLKKARVRAAAGARYQSEFRSRRGYLGGVMSGGV